MTEPGSPSRATAEFEEASPLVLDRMAALASAAEHKSASPGPDIIASVREKRNAKPAFNDMIAQQQALEQAQQHAAARQAELKGVFDEGFGTGFLFGVTSAGTVYVLYRLTSWLLALETVAVAE